MPLNVKEQLDEHRLLQADAARRRAKWTLAREVFKGEYRPPSNEWAPWVRYIDFNMTRRAVLTYANMLMGRGFTINIYPLGTKEKDREAAERAEKALFKTLCATNAWGAFWRAAKLGSLLGTSGFRVWQQEATKRVRIAPFQPEYFHPITASDDYTRLVKVHYAYSMDRTEAAKTFGGSPEDYKTEDQVHSHNITDSFFTRQRVEHIVLSRTRVPVLETYTEDECLWYVGGREIYNGPNTYKFIPFVAIPNIDSCEDIWGLPDIDGLIDMSIALNEVISTYLGGIKRWANPPLLFKRPPMNHAAVVAAGINGGIIPLGPNSELYPLQSPTQPQGVNQLIEMMRSFGIETTGLNEMSWSGTPSGSINTGPSLQFNFVNVQNTLAAKQRVWQEGLQRLMWMVLTLGEQQKSLGYLDSKTGSRREAGSMYSGKDIGKHREVEITWPGIMPSDDLQAANFELAKHQAGVQSTETTMQRLGISFPSDELDKIEAEMKRDGLRARDQANITRANATMLSAASKAGMLEEGAQPESEVPVEETGEVEGDLGVEELPPEQPGIPDDIDELSDLPPGYGTLPDGRVVDAEGNEITRREDINLLRLQAAREAEQLGGSEPLMPEFDEAV